MNILKINGSETIELRSKILRPNLPLATCVFEGDDEENTFHLGSFQDDRLVSVASFYRENHKDIPVNLIQYRLRGMATLEDLQGRGFGKSLLMKAFSMIGQEQNTILWCNARTNALGFYKNLEFYTIGDEFEIEGVGPHFLMLKKFS